MFDVHEHIQLNFTHVLSLQKIEESDLRGVSINMLQLHPNGRCLLIHAKGSVLRMMDLRM